MTTLDGRRDVIMEDTHVSSCWHGTLSADMFSTPNVPAGQPVRVVVRPGGGGGGG